MGKVDDILHQYGLGYEDLNSAERDTLMERIKMMEATEKSMDPKMIRSFIRNWRQAVETELETLRKQTPQNWIGILTLFIPFYGLLRKWYQDEHKIYLEARLRNLRLMEAFLIGPSHAKQALNEALQNVGSIKGGEQRGN